MKILGIGNAIVDVICKVDDQYLINNQLTKSTMKLVDEIEFKKLLSSLNNRTNYLWWVGCKLYCWIITIRK
jgi:sugar/nucleoside kinase (ribokinase family)